MSNGQGLLKAFRAISLILSLGMAMNAQAGLFGIGGTSWKEEALLHDGQKIIVERTLERGGRHEIGQLPSYTKQNLAFTHPTTGQSITWEDKATEDLGTSSFLPMALDIYQEAVYLVLKPMGCLSYNKWGRPNPPYVVFKHGGKTWERVPLQELPLATNAPNLISSSPDTEVERLGTRFVDAEAIRRFTNEYRQPEYRSIVREASLNAKSGCIKTDFYGKTGWLSPDWFTDQPSLDACLNFCNSKTISAEICPCNVMFLGK